MLERDGEGRKDKGGCEGSRSKKSCMWRVVYKGLKRRAHWRAHTAQIRTFFSCTANGNCGARDFFPRWVKTIGEVPGSNASDMQQCGNSEAIRSEINSCDGSLLCKVTIKSFADTILYVCCCYYVWLFWRSFHLRWPWTTAMGLFKCAPYSIAKQSTHYNSQHHRTQLLQRLHQCEACGSNKKHLTKHLTTRQPWICKPHLQVSHA